MDSIITFRFFEFDIETTSVDSISSSNDGMTTVIGLTERENSWGGFEWGIKFSTNPVFHNSINSTNN